MNYEDSLIFQFMHLKPSIFIGSSSEGLSIAKSIELALVSFADCDLWPSIFDLSKSNFDNLASQIAFYDYAILVATADDVVESRGHIQQAMRDNVLFEFGLFTGGLGKAKTILVVEEDVKILSDLSGITLTIIPQKSSTDFAVKLNDAVEKIKKHITDQETTFDLGFLPSTTLAYGYFSNFIEKTVQRLLEDKQDGKVFTLADGTQFKINSLKFSILIPDDLSDDMFNKVSAKRLRDEWQKVKVDPKHVRDYDFSIDVSKVADGCMHLVDIPLTLNALNLSIELYSAKGHIGKSVKESLLEKREIRNFKRTLEYLINKSAFTRGIVEVEVVNI